MFFSGDGGTGRCRRVVRDWDSSHGDCGETAAPGVCMDALLFPTRRELCSSLGRVTEQKQGVGVGVGSSVESRASFLFHYPGTFFIIAGDFNQASLKSVMPKL